MRRWIVLSVLAALLTVPAAAAGPWTQPRGDTAATGFQPEEGPDWPDVALRAELPGSMRAEGDTPPLILEDQVLFLARPYEGPNDEAYRVLSVDVHTGEVTTVADGIQRANRLVMATDGETVFVSSQGTVHAFPLAPDGHEWTWNGEGPDPADGVGGPPGADLSAWTVDWCGWITVQDGKFRALCLAEHPRSAFGITSLLVQLDASTGEMEWWWDADDDREEDGFGSWPVGLAVSGSRAIVQISSGGCFSPEENEPVTGRIDACTLSSEVWAVDTEDGTFDWSRELQSANRTVARVEGTEREVANEPFTDVGNPAISDGAVYVKAGRVHKLNVGEGDTLWDREIGQEDVDPEGGRSGAISLGNDHVYTTSAQTLYRIDQDEPEEGWSRSLDFTAGEGFDEQPIVTPSRLYAVIASPDNPEAVVAFDTEDGDEMWRHEGGEQVFAFSVGEGLIAYTETEFHDDGANTSLVVLGRTEASPSVSAEPATAYPEPGEPVEVALDTTEAGAQGPITRYKAIWGDGTESSWQNGSVLNHTYNTTGDATARFIVANDAGQTASTTQTFHVGEEEPTEPNWIEERFQKENQEMTFGVLGIAIALGGGAIGVARRKRKRSLLQAELDALEQGYEDTKGTPSECEAFLDTRKARARSLALDGKLEEDQVSIVENRAEELRAELRVDALEDRFAFLPYGLVTKARQMVEDGAVTALERDAFLQAIEEDDVLTHEQKALVRERIEQWFARDAGGGTA